jgi:protease-4
MVKKEGGGFVRFLQGARVLFATLVSALFLLAAFFIFIGLFVPGEELAGGNVAVVPIKGTISTGQDGDLLEKGGVPSDKIVDWIKEADEDSSTSAILLEIDSPGGSPVATEEIARAIKEANKTVVAVIRESGASGAFWIATSADYVFASRMSMTGSIGVTGSRLEFAGLIRDYNVTYRQLSSGKYKDAGSRWKEITPEEQELFQKMLDEVHAEFINAVATNRELPVEKIREIAHGFVFTGAQAKELGLIDAIGNKDDAVKHIEQQLNITADLYEFKETKTFFEEIVGLSSYNVGRGIGTALMTRTASDSVKVTT